VRYPGYHIISLDPEAGTFETRLCVLPSPVTGYIIYAVAGILSPVILLLWHYCKILFAPRENKVIYIALNNLLHNEENPWTDSPPKRLRALTRDILSLTAFVLGLFILNALL
jgi:hypothetical protein